MPTRKALLLLTHKLMGIEVVCFENISGYCSPTPYGNSDPTFVAAVFGLRRIASLLPGRLDSDARIQTQSATRAQNPGYDFDTRPQRRKIYWETTRRGMQSIVPAQSHGDYRY